MSKLGIDFDKMKEWYDENVVVRDRWEIKDKCDLCKLDKNKITRYWYEDDKWVILRCKTCHRPMLVYKQHTMFIPIMEFMRVLVVVREIFGSYVNLRMNQRLIKDHFHLHIYGGESIK